MSSKSKRHRPDATTAPAPRRSVTYVPRNLKQRDYLRSIQTNDITFGIGSAGSGKAQPLDSLVLTPTGFKRMGDLRLGDRISCPDSTTAAITAIYPQGIRPIYRITFEDGASAEADIDHLWEVYSDRFCDDSEGTKILTTAEIQLLLSVSGLKKRLYIPLTEPTSVGPQYEGWFDPYVLGILLGDGHFGASISFTTMDAEIVDSVQKFADLHDCKLVKSNQTGRASSWIFRNKQRKSSNKGQKILEYFRQIGLCGKLSHEKYIPEKFFSSDRATRLALLQGLMDSDGTVDINGTISYATTSPKLAHQVTEIVRSLGGLCRINLKQSSFVYKGVKKEGKVSYQCNIRISRAVVPFRLTRKLARLAGPYQYEGHLRRRIRSVEYVGEKEAQCILIDHPSHLYITDNYVVTHNTYLGAMAAIEAFEKGQVERIVISRPAITAGNERHGFIPGDLGEKMDPYLRPILEAFGEYWSPATIRMLRMDRKIDVIPFGFMRGMTFKNAFVIADEAQNTTMDQMFMLLTRLGENSRMIITGDPEQSDIPSRTLIETQKRLEGVPRIGWVEFDPNDVVRHPTVESIIRSWAETGPSLGLKRAA